MAWKTGTELIADAKARIKEITPAESLRIHKEDPSVVFLDCREPNEWNLGRIPGSVFLPRGNIEGNVEARIPRDRKVIVYCARGNRSALAADTMQQMGYDDVASMSQGFIGWVDAGGEVED